MNYTIPLPEALQLAALRRADRWRAIQADLDDLIAGGCKINIAPSQLMQLEDAGLDYDFETGFCCERKPPAEAAPLPVGAITTEIQRRRQNWQSIGDTAPNSEHILLASIEARLQTYTECCDIIATKAGQAG